mgnify:CR=1 FL=1
MSCRIVTIIYAIMIIHTIAITYGKDNALCGKGDFSFFGTCLVDTGFCTWFWINKKGGEYEV